MKLHRSRLAATAAFLGGLLVLVAPALSSAATSGTPPIYVAHEDALTAVGTAASAYGANSDQVRTALRELSAESARTADAVAGLQTTTAAERQYQQVVVDSLREEIGYDDQAASGLITPEAWRIDVNALSRRVQQGVDAISPPVAQKSDAGGLPSPLDKWWFWSSSAPKPSPPCSAWPL